MGVFYRNMSPALGDAKTIEGKITHSKSEPDKYFFTEINKKNPRRVAIKKKDTKKVLFEKYKMFYILFTIFILIYVVNTPFVALFVFSLIGIYGYTFRPYESSKKMKITYRLIQLIAAVGFLTSASFTFSSLGNGNIQKHLIYSENILFSTMFILSFYFLFGLCQKYKTLYEIYDNHNDEVGTGFYLWKKML